MTRISARHILIAAALAAAGGIGTAGSARAAGWEPSEDDALLLELHTKGYKLGDALRGYQTPGGVCVDLADVIQALDLPVRLDKKSRRATGWLFAENQRFTLDRETGIVQNVNGDRPIGAQAILDTPAGWCVDTAALSSWFGVTFRADLANSNLMLESTHPLPFLEALERRSRAARLRPAAQTFDLAQYPRADLPYRAWRAPSVDVLVRAGYKGGAGNQGQRETRYELYAAGEALGVSYDARLASDTLGAPATVRLRGYRFDPDGHLLGPLKATQIAAGDVETYAGNLTGQSAVGRGVFISNRPVQRPSKFAATTLRGSLPGGWDAELYRNGQLVAFQADTASGRYEFPDVELSYGENALEVVLYGPQGQIKRERTDLPVGPESIPVGKTWYWAGLIQQNRDLIDFRSRFSDPQTGWRWGVGVQRGIDQRTMVGLEAQSLITGGRRHSYVEATLRRALGPVLVELSGAQQLGGGRAFHAQMLGRIGKVAFQAETLWIDGGYESELVQINQKREDSLRFDTALKLGGLTVPLQFSARRSADRDGTKVTEVLTRAGLIGRGLSLTGELGYRLSSGRAASRDLDGLRIGLLANTRIGPIRLRGDARFRLSGERRGFETAEIVGETHLTRRSDLRAAFSYARDNGRGEFALGYVRQMDKFALRAEATLGTDGSIGAGLSLAFSVGPDPVRGGVRLSENKLAQNGEAFVTVYCDENGDGRRQAGEEAVAGVQVAASLAELSLKTDAQGRTLVEGLRPFRPVLVGIDGGSVSDPLLKPASGGIVVVPRPGVAARIELALVPTGEVDGTLTGPDGEPRGGIALELVDAAGRTAARIVSDYDGYFLFDNVAYGRYRLRVSGSGSQAASLETGTGEALVIDRAHPSRALGAVRLRSPALPTRIAAGS